jgi:two-component system chemotaxis response regulator CheY
MALREEHKKALGFVNQLEKVLLKGEVELKTTQYSPGTLPSLQQSVHQIKSEMTLLGRTRTASLIHSLGGELSSLKRSRGRLTPELIQGLFSIVDLLRAELQKQEEGEYFPKSFQLPEASKKAYENIYFPLTSGEERSLEQSLNHGRVFLLEKEVPPFLNAEQIASLGWYIRLREEENILFIHPEFKRLSMLEEEQVVSVVFLSQKPVEKIKAQFQSPILEIHKKPRTKGRKERSLFPDLEIGKWRILVIEDDFFDRHFLQDALGVLGRVDVATTAQEARRSVHQALKEDDPYHLMTLDQYLGPDQGEQILQDIRKMEKDRDSFGAKVIAISQNTSGETIMNLLQKDVQAFMVKPITKISLLRQLEKVGLKIS